MNRRGFLELVAAVAGGSKLPALSQAIPAAAKRKADLPLNAVGETAIRIDRVTSILDMTAQMNGGVHHAAIINGLGSISREGVERALRSSGPSSFIATSDKDGWEYGFSGHLLAHKVRSGPGGVEYELRVSVV